MTANTSEDWNGVAIPIERWGKDHWSTFAYAETRAVDHQGYLDLRHLRLDLDYPSLVRPASGSLVWDERVDLFNHTVIDCLNDAVAAGLLLSCSRTMRPRKRHPEFTYQVEFSPRGLAVAGALRAHKADGGDYASFVAPGAVIGT